MPKSMHKPKIVILIRRSILIEDGTSFAAWNGERTFPFIIGPAVYRDHPIAPTSIPNHDIIAAISKIVFIENGAADLRCRNLPTSLC
jgi:hypothetical protein